MGLFYRIIGETGKASQEFREVLGMDPMFREAELNLDDITREQKIAGAR